MIENLLLPHICERFRKEEHYREGHMRIINALPCRRVLGLHLPEMKKITGIENEPVFIPVVDNFYSGMEVTVSLFVSQINGSISDIKAIYKKIYKLLKFN